MGGSQSSSKQEISSQKKSPALFQNSAPLIRNLRLIQKNPQYGGDIRVDMSKRMAYRVMQTDQYSADGFTNMLNNRKMLRFPSLVPIKQYWSQSHNQMPQCEEQYRFIIEMPHLNYTLQDQILFYCKQQRPVPQYQVRQIFSDVVRTLQYLKSNNTCHGDIKPKNILVNQQTKKAFLTDSYFLNGGLTAYEIVMQNPESLSLLSPQQLQRLQQKKPNNLRQIDKDQMFAVGLTMLETMTAQPAMQAYDLKNLAIKNGYFNNKYQQLRSYGYSNDISRLVLDCVSGLPQYRPSFQRFLQIIQAGTNSDRGNHISAMR